MARRHVRPALGGGSRPGLSRAYRPGTMSARRRRCHRWGLILSTWASVGSAQTAYVHMSGAGREVDVTRIAPNIVQFTVRRDSYVRQLNAIAIITDNDVILFDSLTRPSSAAIL